MKERNPKKKSARTRKPRLTPERVSQVVQQKRAGVSMIDICYEHRISPTSVYNWTHRADKREREADYPLFK